MTAATVVEVAVFGLVAFRLWRVVGADTITEPLRERIGERARGFLECPWCAGFWVAAATVAAAWTFGWVTGPPVVVAVAAAAVVGLIGDR